MYGPGGCWVLCKWALRKGTGHVRATRIGLLLFLFSLPLDNAVAQPPPSMNRIDLHDAWTIQTSRKVQAKGDAISTLKFQTEGWYRTSVPMTVLAVQVAAGEFPNPYYGMNLRTIPGIDAYQIGEMFAKIEIPNDSPYAAPWWYRKEFPTPTKHRYVALHFDGINNRANVWINGKKIADAKDVAGAYRTFEFDITPELAKTGRNVVAVEVFPQTLDDLGINWVDWNPTPPDKNMGLWQDVYLTTSGSVEIRYPAVVTHLADNGALAELTILAELRNASDRPVEGKFQAEIAGLGLRVEQAESLAAGETKSVKLIPEDFTQLAVKNAKLWWPAQMGSPNLYDLHTSFSVANAISDSQHTQIGIREITSETTDEGALLVRVNGKRILIRGGGWAPDMMLRRDPERLRAEFKYIQDMNLNTIRLEGKIESDEFFNLADEKGILIMAGWCCCDLWEEWDKWKGDQLAIAKESLRSQSLRLRAHPSLLMWLNASDKPPPAEVEKAYINVLNETSWQNPIVSSATHKAPSTLSGPSGLKMTGPYDYVPPSYWLTDTKHGGAYGFNTETSPGPAVPTPNSLKKFIPAHHLWPVNEVWNFHAGGARFKNLDIYNAALNAEYGAPTDLDDYNRKSQAMAYDGERAMFEAYARNKYTSTGVIQWMLNNAWPSLIWHLYDYNLEPAGGYFGTKKANEPIHILYSYDDGSIAVVNSTYKPVNGMTASVRVLDFNLKELFSQEKAVDVDADGVQKKLMQIPEVRFDVTPTVYFIQLNLKNSTGKIMSSNFYWLSTKKPVCDWEKTNPGVTTPITCYEDMTQLLNLPKVSLKAKAHLHRAKGGPSVQVHLKNTSAALAFQVRLAVESWKADEEILPAFWEDNYISLLPGEERTVEARFLGEHSIESHPRLKISGWNIEPETLAIRKTRMITSRLKKKWD